MTPPAGALRVDFPCVLPLLLGLFAAYGGLLLVNRWQLGVVTLQFLREDVERWITLVPTTKAQIEARYAVAASFLLLLATGAASFGQSWRQMRLSFTKEASFAVRSRGLSARRWAFGAALLLGVMLFLGVEIVGSDLRDTLVPEAFLTLGKCSATGCVKDGSPQGTAYLTFLDQKVMVANALSFIVSVFVAIAACCLVVQGRNTDSADPDAAHRTFVQLVQRWKTHLYFASLFLVSGIVDMAAWRRWPVAYMAEKATSTAAFQAAVEGTVLMHGLIFTITLFAVFFPAASLINDAYVARGLDGKPAGQAAPLPLNDFKDMWSLKEVTKSALAVLAPAISGAVPLIADMVAGIGDP